MTNGFTLVDFSALAEPAKVLIEKVSDAVGWCFDPVQVRRMARADADALSIRTHAEIETDELKRRAMFRFINEEAQRQSNIEAITTAAIPKLEEKSNPADLDNDWVTNFFDKCRITSDTEMQELWSKVLAGEANQPGSFTTRTVNFLSTFSKSDALLFSKLCAFVVHMPTPQILIFDSEAEIYTNHGINFIDLENLDSMGLIKFNHVSGFKLHGAFRSLPVRYHENEFAIECPNEGKNEISTGKVLFTKMGHELFRLAKPESVEGFIPYISEQFITSGNKIINIHRPAPE